MTIGDNEIGMREGASEVDIIGVAFECGEEADEIEGASEVNVIEGVLEVLSVILEEECVVVICIGIEEGTIEGIMVSGKLEGAKDNIEAELTPYDGFLLGLLEESIDSKNEGKIEGISEGADDIIIRALPSLILSFLVVPFRLLFNPMPLESIKSFEVFMLVYKLF